MDANMERMRKKGKKKPPVGKKGKVGGAKGMMAKMGLC